VILSAKQRRADDKLFTRVSSLNPWFKQQMINIDADPGLRGRAIRCETAA
jgi:hypothetical protein